MIRVGTAGWDYEDWNGVVYPPHRPRGFDPLAAIAEIFAGGMKLAGSRVSVRVCQTALVNKAVQALAGAPARMPS